MDRRMFIAAIGGLVTASAAQAQTAGPIGGLFALPGDVLGGGVGILGGAAGLGSGGGDPFALADLMGGEFAIETSRLAIERSGSAAIRNFAQLEINEQVSVAAALGASPGSILPRPDQAAIVRKLAAMRGGRAFDHAYVMGQIQGHRELLANNTRAVQADPDPTVRRVATLSIPTIQTHLAILDGLRRGAAAV